MRKAFDGKIEEDASLLCMPAVCYFGYSFSPFWSNLDFHFFSFFFSAAKIFPPFHFPLSFQTF